ncbi:MAG: hypothetical protein RSG54_08205 [Clostridium sp.]
MKIQFKIPNGRISINTEIFFSEARISNIRKMLKLWMNSSPEPQEVEALYSWLKVQIDAEASLKQQKRYEGILESIKKGR